PRTQSRDVVGVEMRIHGFDQFQIQLAHQLEIAVDALQDGVDDQGLAAVSAGEQICVSARRAVEELAKNHVHLLWLERCRFCGKDVLSGWMSLGDGEALL